VKALGAVNIQFRRGEARLPRLGLRKDLIVSTPAGCAITEMSEDEVFEALGWE